MVGTFYITANESYNRTWYQLIVRKTHFCVSCGVELEKILTVLKSYVKDFRTETRLLVALSQLECGGKVSPATFEQREDYYREHGEDYEDLVDSVVLEALKEAREEDKVNNPLNRARNRLQKAGGVKMNVKTKEESTVEVKCAQQAPPKLLRKPRVFNRK